MVNQSQFIEMFGGDLQNRELLISLQELIDKNWITYHLDGNHGGDYPRGEEFVESGVPYISANCIEDHLINWEKAKYLTKERATLLKKGLAHNNDVLFAHNATVGPVAILHTADDLVILGTSLTAYRCNAEFVLPEYLLAYMDSPVFRAQYEAGMQQSTRNQVPITTQRSYKFLIPPMTAQRMYSAVFQQADKSKFAGFKSQFIEMFGKIPQDKKLAEISEIYDGVHQTPHYTDSGIKFISVEDISDIYGSKKYISIEDYNKYKHVPELDDLIMTRIGTIGLCAVVSKSEPLAYYVSVTLIKPNHNIINSTFLKYYIESGYGQNELRMRSLLEAFPMKINLNEIGKVAVKVPSMESQLAFVQIVQRADKSKYLN